MSTCFLFNDKNEVRVATDEVLPEGAHHVQGDDWVARVGTDMSSENADGFLPLRDSYHVLPHDVYLRAGKAWELLYWSEETQWCSRCGGRMTWHTDISRYCDQCGREVWPQLNIAIIVLVHRGDDEALLVKAKTFRRNFFGLVAGFVETGESLEECVVREVKEETSLDITNLRYFGSQPWPYPLGLMVGFHADYAGGDIRFADGELKEGRFFLKKELADTPIPEKLSMARMLIDDWLGA